MVNEKELKELKEETKDVNGGSFRSGFLSSDDEYVICPLCGGMFKESEFKDFECPGCHQLVPGTRLIRRR